MSNKKYSLGEFVVVIDGERDAGNRNTKDISSDMENIIRKILNKFSLTETVEIVHKISYIEKKRIYKKAIDIKNEKNS